MSSRFGGSAHQYPFPLYSFYGNSEAKLSKPRFFFRKPPRIQKTSKLRWCRAVLQSTGESNCAIILHRPSFALFMKTFRVETRSLPTLARCCPRSHLPVRSANRTDSSRGELGPFYVTRPAR